MMVSSSGESGASDHGEEQGPEMAEKGLDKARRQSSHSATPVAEVLKQYISKLAQLHYRESLRGSVTPWLPQLKANAPMLLDLRAGPVISGNLGKKAATQALSALIQHHPEWNLAGQDMLDTIRVKSLALRAMLRDIQQQDPKSKKRPAAEWATKLGFFACDVAPRPEQVAADASTTCAASATDEVSAGSASASSEVPIRSAVSRHVGVLNAYDFAWDDDLQSAYRKAGADAKPEYCNTIRPGLGKTDPVVAVWSDGVEWQVPVMTTSQKATAVQRDDASGKWQSWPDRKNPGSLVLLKPSFRRGVKSLIIWHKHGGKQLQICELRLKGDDDDQEAQAMHHMSELAQLFADGTYTKEMVTAEKWKRWQSKKRPAAVIMKRPAAGGVVLKKPSVVLAEEATCAADGEGGESEQDEVGIESSADSQAAEDGLHFDLDEMPPEGDFFEQARLRLKAPRLA